MTDIALAQVKFHAVTERTTVERAMSALEEGRGGWIVPVNLDVLRQCSVSAELGTMLHDADLVVADGQPLIWASRLTGVPLPERVTGSNLIWSLSAEAARRGRSVFLLGGDPGTAEEAAQRLCAHAPGLEVAGMHCPPFGFDRDPDQIDAIRTALREARPDLVYVGLGFPKQERLIRQLRKDLPAAWFMGVGISISFAAGRVRRAPVWMHGLGLEWLHRLVQDPRRLGSRYLVHGIPFAAWLLTLSALARRPAP